MSIIKRIPLGLKELQQSIQSSISSAKTTIQNWCNERFSLLGHKHTVSELGIGSFPTWTSVQNVSAKVQYIAETDGYLLIGIGGGNGNYSITTVINGTTYSWPGQTGAYKYGWMTMQLCLPMAKGTTYYFTHTQTLRFARFLSAI